MIFPKIKSQRGKNLYSVYTYILLFFLMIKQYSKFGIRTLYEDRKRDGNF